jgi:hypothetical protein
LVFLFQLREGAAADSERTKAALSAKKASSSEGERDKARQPSAASGGFGKKSRGLSLPGWGRFSFWGKSLFNVRFWKLLRALAFVVPAAGARKRKGTTWLIKA